MAACPRVCRAGLRAPTAGTLALTELAGAKFTALFGGAFVNGGGLQNLTGETLVSGLNTCETVDANGNYYGSGGSGATSRTADIKQRLSAVGSRNRTFRVVMEDGVSTVYMRRPNGFMIFMK